MRSDQQTHHSLHVLVVSNFDMGTSGDLLQCKEEDYWDYDRDDEQASETKHAYRGRSLPVQSTIQTGSMIFQHLSLRCFWCAQHQLLPDCLSKPTISLRDSVIGGQLVFHVA